MTEKIIREKLEESDEFVNHAGAVITDYFISAVKNRIDDDVMDDRVKILYQNAKIDYDRKTVSRYAIQDIAKAKKLHFFLNSRKEEIIKSVIKMFNTDKVSSEFIDNK
jgi:hypothetical protein